ncbi:MAG: hypothetical protein LBV51_04080, partial [Acholeplasmatales bacterium]|nr:hypothetical protein [Acholeplasmatales bacterium]
MWNNIIEWLQVNPWFGAFDKFFEEHEAIRFMYTRWFLGVVLIFIVEIVLIAIGVHRINKKKKIAYALLEAEEKRNIEKENEVVSFEDQVLDFNTDIDFYAEALKRKDEFLGDLEGLLRINSELTEFN